MTPRRDKLAEKYGRFEPRHPKFRFVTIGGRTCVELQEPLLFVGNDLICSDALSRGYIANGQDVPWLLEKLAGDRFDEPFILPSLFHDRDCNVAQRVGGPSGYLMRQIGDWKFRVRILACGGSQWQAARQYIGVTFGRWRAWARGDFR